MKTFTIIESNNSKNAAEGFYASVYVIEEDLKREGLYKMTRYSVNNNPKNTRGWSCYYGKNNQARILELSKKMIEVEEKEDDSWMDGELTDVVSMPIKKVKI